MSIDNAYIYTVLKNMAQFMELYEENIFKINSYKKASLLIKKIPVDITKLSINQIMNIEGIGKTIAHNIQEIVETGSIKQLDEYTQKTPPGVIGMFKINGLGIKKVALLWKNLGIDNLEKLRIACKSDKVASLKRFGEKTQTQILTSIDFIDAHKNKFLYAFAISYAEAFKKLFKSFFTNNISCTGQIRRKLEIIDYIEFIISFTEVEEVKKIIEWLEEQDLLEYKKKDHTFWEGSFKDSRVRIKVHFSQQNSFYKDLFITTGSSKHIEITKEWVPKLQEEYANEEAIYKEIAFAAKNKQISTEFSKEGFYIPPELREGKDEFSINAKTIANLITTKDIKGILHAHSTYSDGVNTLENMVKACISQKFEYLGISDHSQVAVYAGGMNLETIEKQHKEIDFLNKKYSPFKIFKGIECDILKDGTLDYKNEILKKFDFVIASIHSNFRMTKEEATCRLCKAIRNPYTSILGHPTARLLLRRYGYPIDYEKIIEECVKHNVVIEINASPERLDLDWRWIKLALDKGALISINPDAHSSNAYTNIQYGVNIARKGCATKEKVLSALSKETIKAFFYNPKFRSTYPLQI